MKKEITTFEADIASCNLTNNMESNFQSLISYLGIEPIVSNYFKMKYNIENNPSVSDIVYFLNTIQPDQMAAALMCLEATHRTGYSNAIIRPMVLSCFVTNTKDTETMKQANKALKERQQLSENQIQYIAKSIAHNAARNKDFDYSFLLDIKQMSIVYFNQKQWEDYIYKKYNEFVYKMGHSPSNFTDKLMTDLLSYKYKTSYSTIKRFNVNHQAIINSKKSFVLDYCREIGLMMIQPRR